MTMIKHSLRIASLAISAIIATASCMQIQIGEGPDSATIAAIIGTDDRTFVAQSDHRYLPSSAAIVRIRTHKQKACNGHFADPLTILTATHCVSNVDANSVRVEYFGRALHVTAISSDANNEAVARLHLGRQSPSYKYMPVPHQDRPVRLMSLSFATRQLAVQTCQLKPYKTFTTIWVHDCDSNPGNSGAPFIQDGQFVAMHLGSLVDEETNQPINIAVSLSGQNHSEFAAIRETLRDEFLDLLQAVIVNEVFKGNDKKKKELEKKKRQQEAAQQAEVNRRAAEVARQNSVAAALKKKNDFCSIVASYRSQSELIEVLETSLASLRSIQENLPMMIHNTGHYVAVLDATVKFLKNPASTSINELISGLNQPEIEQTFGDLSMSIKDILQSFSTLRTLAYANHPEQIEDVMMNLSTAQQLETVVSTLNALVTHTKSQFHSEHTAAFELRKEYAVQKQTFGLEDSVCAP